MSFDGGAGAKAYTSGSMAGFAKLCSEVDLSAPPKQLF
jgi:hypothetical protein